MITEESILNELQNRGYHVEIRDIIKNSVCLRGLMIREGDSGITPCIYIDNMLSDYDSPKEAADDILNLYESNRTPNIGCDVNHLTDPDFIKSNVYIGLQKSSEEDIIKRPSIYEGIEEYLYLRGKTDDNSTYWSIKLKDPIISGIDKNDLWKIAENHTFNEFQITSLMDTLKSMGFDFGFEKEIPLYVITNNEKYRGAALACDMESIKKWAFEHNIHKAVIFPSSVHEMLLHPIDEDENCNMEDYNSLVSQINLAEVNPIDRLTDQAYMLEL